MINKILKICKEYEEKPLWDIKSSDHYYFLSYNKKEIEISIIEIYQIKGKNDIMMGKDKTIIKKLQCTANEYLQIIKIFKKNEIEEKYSNITNKIIIRGE